MNKLAYYQGYMDKEALFNKILPKRSQLLKMLRARKAVAGTSKFIRKLPGGKDYLQAASQNAPAVTAAFALPGVGTAAAAAVPVVPAALRILQKKSPATHTKLLQLAQTIGSSGVF